MVWSRLITPFVGMVINVDIWLTFGHYACYLLKCAYTKKV